MKLAENIKTAAAGAVCGLANGFFGSGGGIIAVPLLEQNGMEIKKAHATSLAITLPMSLVSAAIYYAKGNLDLPQTMAFLPGGLAGAAAGAAIMKKISPVMLKRLFGAVMIYFGVRMLVF